MYRVFLEGLEVTAHVGVTEEEKLQGHRVVADVILEVEGNADDTDRVQDTADYAEIARVVSERLTGTTLDTLERLGSLVCEDLISGFSSVRGATVRLAKIDPPMHHSARLAGVEVSRER